MEKDVPASVKILLLLTGGGLLSFFSAWMGFWTNREKNKTDAKNEETDRMLQSFDRFEEIRRHMREENAEQNRATREDFNQQILVLQGDMRMLNQELRTAEATIRDLAADLEASRAETAYERELRLKAEQLSEANGARISVLEALIKKHDLPLNGNGEAHP